VCFLLEIVTCMIYNIKFTIQVTYMKKNTHLEQLKDLFLKKKILEIHDVIHAVNATSRMTAYRYLKILDYISSYTHARQFYTLRTIPEFDSDGLWHFGEVGFSKHGTLMETIIHLVNHSKSGKTNSDLEKQQRIYVQNALLSLFKTEKIRREEQNGVYVYFSADPKIRCNQMEKRNKIGGNRKQVPMWIVVEVLIETIRLLTGAPSIDEVMACLAKRGSSITREQVEQVFEEHNLEKKTLD
jgi:hypothetical protein